MKNGTPENLVAAIDQGILEAVSEGLRIQDHLAACALEYFANKAQTAALQGLSIEELIKHLRKHEGLGRTRRLLEET